MKAHRLLLIVLVVVSVLHGLYWYPRLPDTLVCRVDLEGNPTGHMAKASLFRMHFSSLAVTALACGLLPLLMPRIPARMLSLPRRDYWMAPERREEAILFVQWWTGWLGVGIIAVLLAVHHSICVDSLTPDEPTSKAFTYVILVAVPLLIAVWLGVFWVKFLKKGR